MTHLKGSAILILILVFIMLLAACGGTASSVTPTATAAALVKGEFVGAVGRLAGIGLSTNPLPRQVHMRARSFEEAIPSDDLRILHWNIHSAAGQRTR